MSLLSHGTKTFPAEVTHISTFGIWLLSEDKELFLSYNEFPWFKNQTVEAILQVEEPRPRHYYWPKIDIDLTLDMIENPERYPMKAGI